MWSIKYPINIVTSQNSWFESHATFFVDELRKKGFQSSLSYSHENVEEGSISIYLSYMRIVPEPFISRTYQSLVVHASNLPHGKGFSPWVWQILEGKNDIPLCLFKMEAGLDEGDIFKRHTLHLVGDELIDQIRLLLAHSIWEMILSHLTSREEPESFPQEGDSTFYRRRTKEDSVIDIQRSILEQFNILRVVDNEQYPAHFYYLGKKYILKVYNE